MPRRDRYPKAANPVRFALMAATHEAELNETRICELLAIDALEAGTATVHDLRRLEFLVRMAQELGRTGIGPEVLPLCKDALQTTPPCAGMMREIFEYHEAQREATSPAQYMRAIERL